ncbi:MAG: hypothetical protein JST58_13435, partial [Bacteroidetes bacterium]|nr:hypothetical protein [Bacteroidota bacterium]
ESLSPYTSMGNDPIKHNDPKGDLPCCETASAVWQATQQAAEGADPEVGRELIEAVGTIATVGAFLYDVSQTAPALNTSGLGVAAPKESAHDFVNRILQKIKPQTIPPGNILQAKGKKDYGKSGGAEHTAGARASTRQDHQDGLSRKQQDRQGSKGMRNPPRKRPHGHNGPWPPKKPDPPPPPNPPPPPPPSQNPPNS